MYGLTDLSAFAAELPDAWRSTVVARVGGAQVKVVRMDAAAYDAEVHDYDEALIVLDGAMELDVAGERVSVGAAGMYLVPAGVPHAVAPGSRGTLLIVDV